MDVNEAWGSVFQYANTWLEVANPVPGTVLDEAVDGLGDITGLTALDVGCGKGRLVEALAGRGAIVTGFDSSLEVLHSARRRILRTGLPATLLHADSPPRGSWDIVAVAGSAHVLVEGDISGLFGQVAEIVRPHGALVFADCYWRKPPPPAAANSMAPEGRGIVDRHTLLNAARLAGWTLTWEYEATSRDLAAYFDTTCGALRTTARHHPELAKLAYLARLNHHHYTAWLHNTAGFVVWSLRLARSVANSVAPAPQAVKSETTHFRSAGSARSRGAIGGTTQRNTGHDTLRGGPRRKP